MECDSAGKVVYAAEENNLSKDRALVNSVVDGDSLRGDDFKHHPHSALCYESCEPSVECIVNAGVPTSVKEFVMWNSVKGSGEVLYCDIYLFVFAEGGDEIIMVVRSCGLQE